LQLEGEYQELIRLLYLENNLNDSSWKHCCYSVQQTPNAY